MVQGSVLIAAGKSSQPFYRSLHLSEERIVISSLQDAADIMKRSAPDLILLDCGLNPTWGLRLLKKIKSLYADVPVLFLTDASSEAAVIKAFHSGARQYLKKPVRVAELKGAMKSLLRIKRESHEKRAPLIAAPGADSRPCIRFVTTDLPPNILCAINYIEEHLCGEIRLDTLAREANLSKYHFCRLFRKCAGIPPMRLVACMRIRMAEELLRKKDCSVSTVADEVGFKECGSFDRQFKKLTSVTPTTYKNSRKKKKTA